MHADVLLWFAKVLGAGVVLDVYFCLRNCTPRRTAFIGALTALAFSTTSNYFAWPYSFSNLWATCLSLFAVNGYVRWYNSGKRSHLIISLACTLIVVASKFIIALPILVALWGILFNRRAEASPALPQVRNIIITICCYSGLVVFFFYLLTVYFGRDVSSESYLLQAGAVFHARHLAAAGLYERFSESIFLQNGLSPENISASLSVLLCPFSVLFGVVTWIILWKRSTSSGPTLVTVAPLFLFAAGNLLQMNSSVHAPYVFPASAVVLFASIQLWLNAAPVGRTRLITLLLGGAITAFCLLLGIGRLVKSTDAERMVEINTPRLHFYWARPNGPYIQNVADYIQQHSSATDKIIVFSPHDFLYLMGDRKPALGYFYTWYEPFHDANAVQRVIATLESAAVPLVITDLEDPFSLAFAPDYRSHPIYETLRKNYFPRINRDSWGSFVIWEKKPATPKTALK